MNAVQLPPQLHILAGKIEDELSVWADRDPARHHPETRRSADRACKLIGDLIAGLAALRDEVTAEAGAYDDDRRRQG